MRPETVHLRDQILAFIRDHPGTPTETITEHLLTEYLADFPRSSFQVIYCACVALAREGVIFAERDTFGPVGTLYWNPRYHDPSIARIFATIDLAKTYRP